MKEHMLTTVDNPWNYFTQFDEWYAHDQGKGHDTLGLIARALITSDELSEEDQSAAIEDAIDDIIESDALGIYRKVESPADDVDEDADESPDDEGEDVDEDEDEGEPIDDDEWAEIVAEMSEELSRAVGDNKLKHYWTKGKGLARWVNHPHPWTRLRNLLRKHVGPGRAERIASEWFHDVKGIWPGHRKGKNPVGPG